MRSFDGDRVMGVFLDGAKNTAAVKTGLQINWFFLHALVPKFRSFYSTTLGDFPFAQTVGVDAGQIHVARGGVRNDNDLVWVGRAPNIAAKLSSIREAPRNTYITADVYNTMLDDAKFGDKDKQNMWTARTWKAGEPYGVGNIYGSTWWWEP